MDVTFNDISVDISFSNAISKDEGRHKFLLFLQMIHELSSQGIFDYFFFPNNFLMFYIASKYTVMDWLHDTTVPYEKKQFLRSFYGRTKKINIKNIEGEFNYNVCNLKLKGLGCAYSWENTDSHIVISINTSSNHWQNPEINGTYCYFNENCILDEKSIKLRNLSNNYNIKDLKKESKEIQNKLLLKCISSGQDLWEQREKLFPNLIFCSSVKNQLYLYADKSHVEKVIEKLNVFQNYFAEEHLFYNHKDLGLDARSESDSVKKNDDHVKKRTFKLPSGEKKTFLNHISFNGFMGGGRIYFLPDIENRKCYIGYIGKHLKTKKY